MGDARGTTITDIEHVGRVRQSRVSLAHKAFSSAIRRGPAMTLLGLACWAGFAIETKASCGISVTPRSAVSLPKSMLFAGRAALQPSSETDAQQASIVGLWYVTLSSAGQVVDQGFDAWHSDGTEVLNDNPAPGAPNGTGGVCLGVYEKTASGSYKLRHPGWIFDADGNFAGLALIEEEITVDKGENTYGGTFLFLSYDLDGNITGRVDGTLRAVRITPD